MKNPVVEGNKRQHDKQGTIAVGDIVFDSYYKVLGKVTEIRKDLVKKDLDPYIMVRNFANGQIIPCRPRTITEHSGIDMIFKIMSEEEYQKQCEFLFHKNFFSKFTTGT